jgi:creatinine amidohydrolase
MRTDAKHRYEKLTWPEVNDAVEDEKLVLIPVGSTEDHGPHLPLDVDQVLPTTICERVAADRSDTLLFPTVSQGYLPHHMDYPGGITIDWETFVKRLVDIGVSLAHHGFQRLLFVNGHGSNHHLVEQASRLVNIQYPDTHAAMLSWWEIDALREIAVEVLDGDARSSGHAAELETSMYLHISPDDVDMAAAPRDVSYPETPIFYTTDLVGREAPGASTHATMMEWWSTISETGVKGDASIATAEKGEALLAAAVAGLDELVGHFQDYPIREIEDKHVVERTDRDYDPFRPK